MIRSLCNAYAKRAYRRDFEKYVPFLEHSTDEELAAILASALGTRQVILKRGREILPYPFPEDLLDGMRVPTDQDRGRISKQCFAIIHFKKALLRQGGRIATGASGFTVWQFSMRAITDAEFIPYGRRMWSALLRGKRFLVEMDFSSLEDAYWVPAILAPEDDGPPV